MPHLRSDVLLMDCESDETVQPGLLWTHLLKEWRAEAPHAAPNDAGRQDSWLRQAAKAGPVRTSR
jgi:hypothetical protein